MRKAWALPAKIAVVVLLVLLSYLRHTYYLNPNFAGISFLVPIRGEAADSGVFAFRSMIVFFFLFGGLNWLFGQIFLSVGKGKYMLYIFAGIMVFCALLFGVYKLSGYIWLFHTGSILKNFILSPVYTLLMFFVLSKLVFKDSN